jgi:uncharacterized membrane protein
MTQFFGHFHPLLVHLPIGLILIVAALEWLSRFPRFKNVNANASILLVLAVPLAAFTALCGWLLSIGSSYDSHLLQWHQWTGIGTAAACALAAFFFWIGWKGLYRFSLIVTLLVLVVASHYGGSLTHGSDYLVRYAPQPLKTLFSREAKAEPKVQNIADLRAFNDVVQPILDKNCISCHGAEKAEASLRLDSLQSLMKGGKSGAVIVSGKSNEISLLARIRLPGTEKEHMPPEGKPQPGSAEIAWLQWWIDAGAPSEKKVGQIKIPARILRTLQARYGAKPAIAKSVSPKALKEIEPVMAKLSEDLGILVAPITPNQPWIECNASIAGNNFGDTEIARLTPLINNIRWLDLRGTKVADAAAKTIGAMPNLVRLHLERTKITDKGLPALASLPELQYLNLYGTDITDSGLQSLLLLPRLKQIYLWQTKVTPAAARDFAESLTDNDELERLREQVAQLNAKMKSERVIVEYGSQAASTANSSPMNTICPVSDKAIDPAKTLLYEGNLVAFCCDDCREKFRRDPKPLLAKLSSKSTAEPKGEK